MTHWPENWSGMQCKCDLSTHACTTPLSWLHMRVQRGPGHEDDDGDGHGYSRDGKADGPRYLHQSAYKPRKLVQGRVTVRKATISAL